MRCSHKQMRQKCNAHERKVMHMYCKHPTRLFHGQHRMQTQKKSTHLVTYTHVKAPTHAEPDNYSCPYRITVRGAPTHFIYIYSTRNWPDPAVFIAKSNCCWQVAGSGCSECIFGGHSSIAPALRQQPLARRTCQGLSGPGKLV